MWLEETILNDELAHHGVLGMKWGRRKNGSSYSDKTMVRKNRSANRGDVLIKKSGSKGKAQAVAAGKLVAAQVLGNIAGSALSKVPDRRIRNGSAIVGGLLVGAYQTKQIINLVDINNSNKRTLGS
jgi:hypothetical protein